MDHVGIITGGFVRKRVLLMTSSRGEAHKLRQIDRFGHANLVDSSNFYDTTEKFDYPFSLVFIFGNMFRVSHGVISVPVTSSNNFVSFTNYIG